ncbi:MAG: sugar phosphate isomerase/epimerase family protein [Pseudomonadota bacterium]
MPGIAGVGFSTTDLAQTLGDLGTLLDWAEELELASVELSLSNFEVIGGCKIWPDRMAELARICADRPFGFTVHGPIASSFGDIRNITLQTDAARACLEVSHRIGATAQVTHAALLPLTEAERVTPMALERETLAALAPEFADAGVALCVETLFPHGPVWVASPAELAEQIRAVDHPNIRACIDFSHVFLNAAERGFNAYAELATLAPLAAHLHVHDSFAWPRSFAPYSHSEAILFGLGDLHLPPGRGSLPWEQLAALPFADGIIANLELISRHRDQIPSAVAWTRDWIARGA